MVDIVMWVIEVKLFLVVLTMVKVAVVEVMVFKIVVMLMEKKYDN